MRYVFDHDFSIVIAILLICFSGALKCKRSDGPRKVLSKIKPYNAELRMRAWIDFQSTSDQFWSHFISIIRLLYSDTCAGGELVLYMEGCPTV